LKEEGSCNQQNELELDAGGKLTAKYMRNSSEKL